MYNASIYIWIDILVYRGEQTLSLIYDATQLLQTTKNTISEHWIKHTYYKDKYDEYVVSDHCNTLDISSLTK